MLVSQVTSWPQTVTNVAIAVAVIGVAWALAWASVHVNRDDPFWNRKLKDEGED